MWRLAAGTSPGDWVKWQIWGPRADFLSQKFLGSSLRICVLATPSIAPLPQWWTDPHLTITHHLGQREPDWDSVLLLGLLHRLVLFSYVRCGTKYLLNLPRKRPNSEHSWKQFIVSLYTLTWALCHYGRSHKADRGSALPYHSSQCSFMDKKHYSYIVLAWNWLC